ncbi:hypothetical protein OIU77_006936 [Salix suchowensis]|uniref:YTH domain-containing family protein n=1 Tax=Salix suchowensis TaxID=1278906 RepID=A0ABQ9AMD6_9ROSI|nr:hypothetical protein OIU77_006936 [Salix suchowensis]
MEAVTSATDKAAGLLENLSLDSQAKTAGNPAPAMKDFYGDNGNFIYNQGYGYAPFGAYPSPNSPIPTMGYDGQLYGAQQQYQYPGSFYHPSTSAGLFYPSNQPNHSQGHVASAGTADKVPFSAGTATRNSNNKVNAGSVNRSNGPATGAGFSSTPNTHPTRPISGMDQASGYMNLMNPNNRMYGQYGNRMYGQYGSRAGADFGSYAYNSWTNGRGWVVVDNKYKSRGHGYGNENRDGLNELNRGPRAKSFRNQKEFGAVTQTAEGRNISNSNLPQIPEREQYNQEDFPEEYSDAKFFVIKVIQ